MNPPAKELLSQNKVGAKQTRKRGRRTACSALRGFPDAFP